MMYCTGSCLARLSMNSPNVVSQHCESELCAALSSQRAEAAASISSIPAARSCPMAAVMATSFAAGPVTHDEACRLATHAVAAPSVGRLCVTRCTSGTDCGLPDNESISLDALMACEVSARLATLDSMAIRPG